MYNFVFAQELIQSLHGQPDYGKYLYPLMNNKSFSSYIFTGKRPGRRNVSAPCFLCMKASLQKDFGYELKIQSHIGSLFTAFASHLPAAFAPAQNAGREEELLKDMLHYVELHLAGADNPEGAGLLLSVSAKAPAADCSAVIYPFPLRVLYLPAELKKACRCFPIPGRPLRKSPMPAASMIPVITAGPLSG